MLQPIRLILTYFTFSSEFSSEFGMVDRSQYYNTHETRPLSDVNYSCLKEAWSNGSALFQERLILFFFFFSDF